MSDNTDLNEGREHSTPEEIAKAKREFNLSMGAIIAITAVGVALVFLKVPNATYYLFGIFLLIGLIYVVATARYGAVKTIPRSNYQPRKKHRPF